MEMEGHTTTSEVVPSLRKVSQWYEELLSHHAFIIDEHIVDRKHIEGER